MSVAEDDVKNVRRKANESRKPFTSENTREKFQNIYIFMIKAFY